MVDFDFQKRETMMKGDDYGMEIEIEKDENEYQSIETEQAKKSLKRNCLNCISIAVKEIVSQNTRFWLVHR